MDNDNQSNDNQDQRDEIERQLAEAREEARTNLAGWQRAQADFENFKKRKESENKDLIEFAKEVTVTRLLPTLDSLEQGLKQMPNIDNEELTKWKNGIDGVIQQLQKALQEMGVEKIQAKGKKFDPNFHEAVREVEGEEDGIVVEEYQVGYKINGKVIRPSQVVISKNQGE